MSNCGGYASTISETLAVFLMIYQGFMYESSLTKRLFREKKTNLEEDKDQKIDPRKTVRNQA